MKKIHLFFPLLLCLTTSAMAGDWWTINVTPQGLHGNYPGSPIREKIDAEGAIVDLQYLERFGFAFGNTHLNLHYKNSIPTLHQDTVYFSLRDYQTPDFLPGILTLRLDAYKIYGNDPTNETTNAIVGSPIISFLNYKQTYYFDLGYAYSKYGTSNIGNNDLMLSQIAPTVGLGFNESTNWVRFRLYGIHSSNPDRSQDTNQTYGLEIKLTHYMIPYRVFIPQQIQVGVLIGQRIYAVDSDALVVYNLGDLQKDGAYLQAQWKISPHVYFLLNGGSLHFETSYNNTNYPYKLNYVYAGINIRI